MRKPTKAEEKKRAAFEAGDAPPPSARARWLLVVRSDGVTLAYTTSRETADRLAALLGARVADKRSVRRGRPAVGPLAV